MKIYNAEPTPARFHACDAFVRGLMGPIGSGKSVTCCMEILARAARQTPNKEGIRKSRWGIIRNTFGELRSTTIKTWQDWVPDSECPIVYDSPIRGGLRQRQQDGTIVELEVLFIALDRPDHVRKLLSLELTGAWINEAREVPKAILDGLTGRVGRYPNLSDGGASWSGIVMDTNPMDTDHWWYKLSEDETPRGYEFFKQPPALLYDEEFKIYKPNPTAENVQNHILRYEYWLRQVPGKQGEWINVYILGQYGSVQEGKPVYPEYNDDAHCKPFEPVTNLPLIVAFDFGLTPSVAIGQVSPRGRLLIADELVSEDMGITQFSKDFAIPHLRREYGPIFKDLDLLAITLTTGDPAGTQRAQTDEKTCFEALREAGFQNIRPASTNSFIARREAVANYLTKMVDGVPCFQISPKAKTIRAGFLGGYRYQRVRVSGEERFKDQPEKNKYSHPHDALQYLAMLAAGGVQTIDDLAGRSNSTWTPTQAGSM